MSEPNHYELLTVSCLATLDADVAHDSENEAEQVSTDESTKEELVPFSVTFEVFLAQCILFRVPLEDVREEDFVAGKKTDSTEAQEGSIK